MRDERTGTMHRYAGRSGVKTAFILAPSGVPETILTRAALWNAAEGAENRKNSRVAREVILALPHELDDKARELLTRDMGLYLIERYRVAVDVAIHTPVEGDGHDPRNHHAHLLFTTREITKDGFGAKTRVLDDKTSGPEEIEIIRQVWETLANDVLERAGLEVTIDRRSLEDQGVDRIPQIHEGKAARNAKTSLVASAFARASDDEDDDTDEDSDKGKSTQSSSSSSQGQSPQRSGDQTKQTDKQSTDNKNKRYQQIDTQASRVTFNQEIKDLNDQRSRFNQKPVDQQIKILDRMMERLDRRLIRLEQLELRLSPRTIIRHLMETATRMALHSLLERRKTQSQRERRGLKSQIKQYSKRGFAGQKSRVNIHNKINALRQDLETLHQKHTNLNIYRGLVDRIEVEMKREAAANTARSGAGDSRTYVGGDGPSDHDTGMNKQCVPDNRIMHYKLVVLRDDLQDKMDKSHAHKKHKTDLKASTAIAIDKGKGIEPQDTKNKRDGQAVSLLSNTQNTQQGQGGDERREVYRAIAKQAFETQASTANKDTQPMPHKIKTDLVIDPSKGGVTQAPIIGDTTPPNKTAFKESVRTEATRPIEKIKVDLGIWMSDAPGLGSQSTPSNGSVSTPQANRVQQAKAQFNDAVKRPSQADKPITRIKVDLGIRTRDHTALKAKSAFNAVSGTIGTAKPAKKHWWRWTLR